MNKALPILTIFCFVCISNHAQWSPPASSTDFITTTHTNGTQDFGLNLESSGGTYRYFIENNLTGTNQQAFYFGHANSTKNIFGIGTSGNSGSSWTPRFVINQNGNVGIGTSSPTFKLSVKGNVNVGHDGNYKLRVRHVDGKQTNSTSLDDLFLNYNTGENVRVGFGSTNSQSNLYLSGRLGIGFTSPTHHIDVRNDIDPTESFLRFRVQDAADDYFSIVNSTSAAGQFIPRLIAYRTSDNRYSVQYSGATSEANDNGSNALVNFDARRSNGPIQTRPLFVWTSYTTKMMTMLANGNLGIGTAAPDAKLAVNGNVHAKEVKVDLVGWPDYVFNDDYGLPTLQEVERHIKEKGHLINIPSANDVDENGVQLGEMNKLLLEKIEELTLYTIAQQNAIEDLKELKAQNQLLHSKVEQLEKALQKLIVTKE